MKWDLDKDNKTIKVKYIVHLVKKICCSKDTYSLKLFILEKSKTKICKYSKNELCGEINSQSLFKNNTEMNNKCTLKKSKFYD